MSDTFVIAADESGSLVCAWSGSARAVLPIDADGAAFVPGPWRGKLADLAPAEALGLEAMEIGALDALHTPHLFQPAIRELARSKAQKKRAPRVPAYETAEDWLAAMGNVRLLDRAARPDALGQPGRALRRGDGSDARTTNPRNRPPHMRCTAPRCPDRSHVYMAIPSRTARLCGHSNGICSQLTPR